MKRAGQGGEEGVVGRVDVIEDRPWEGVLAGELAQEADQSRPLRGVADRVAAGIRPECRGQARVGIAEGAQMQLQRPVFRVVEPRDMEQHEEGKFFRFLRRGGRAGHGAVPDRRGLVFRAVGIRDTEQAVVGGPAAGGGEIGMPFVDRGNEPGERVGAAAGGVGEPAGPGLHAVGFVHPDGRVGTERRHDLRRELVAGDAFVPLEAVGWVVGRAHHLDLHPPENAPRGEVARGQLPVGLVPDPLGGGVVQDVIDAKVAAQLQVRPVEERIAERVRHGLGPRLEFFPRGGGAGDPLLRDAVGPHGPPLVVVAIEPDGVQVFKPPVLGDVARAQVAVVVDDGLPSRDIVIEGSGCVAGEQEGVVAEGHRRPPGIGRESGMGQPRAAHDTAPRGGLQRRSIDDPEQGDQHDGADGGRDQAPQHPVGRQSKQAEEEAAEQGADHAHDQVADEPEATALHDLTAEPAGSDADQKKPEKGHRETREGRVRRGGGLVTDQGMVPPPPAWGHRRRVRRL